ncbi:MAG: NADH-quinone oxidoreductase subunit M [Demequinaceae bacterium]|nr:NADH-quinone oxidoreductase subunit M [Demequinaceae bacterium]
MVLVFPYLTALVVLPTLGAILVKALGGRSRVREVAIGVALVEAAVAIAMAIQFNPDRAGIPQLRETHSWIPQIGASWALGVTGLGLVLVLLAVVLTPLVILAAWKEDTDPVRAGNYLALILFLESFMVGVFAAQDLFLFYILFEAMLIPLYFLIGLFGGEQRRYAAVKFLLYSLVGGLVMLVAVVALYAAGPGGEQGFLLDNLTGLSLDQNAERLMFLAFFVAFAIKAPMVPLHTWLPTVAQTARVGTTTLLVSVLDKVGTFGMLTLCLPLFPHASDWAAPVIIVLAVVSVIYGALLAIGQEDLLRLVAYASISHFGLMVLGIFVFRQTAAEGAALYMLAHGLSTGAFFLVVGFLAARRGSVSVKDFGGLQRVTPVLAGFFLVAGLSALALPGLAPFVPEIMVLVGSFDGARAAVVVAAAGAVLAALYILLAYQKVFTGPRPEGEAAAIPDLSWREKIAVGPLIALLLVLGFLPGLALDVLREPAEAAIAPVVEVANVEVSE